jgi:hypothetical protein
MRHNVLKRRKEKFASRVYPDEQINIGILDKFPLSGWRGGKMSEADRTCFPPHTAIELQI